MKADLVVMHAGYRPGRSNITVTSSAGKPELAKYTPKTINAAVTTSISNDSGSSSSTGVTRQHTSGSSTSQSNTYGGSLSLGFLGDALTGGVTADHSHTTGSERSVTDLTGRDSNTSSSSNSSSGETMSVKDWACYSSVDSNDSSPTWVWGQEYPWNVIQYNNGDSQGNVILPKFVESLLYYTDAQGTRQALPPSQLSLFGVDFTMKAVWIVEPRLTTITHTMQYCTATHGTTQAAAINHPLSFTYTTPNPIDLCLYGLDPILESNSAIIGFIPSQFNILPVAATAQAKPKCFKIMSTSNNLIINDITQYPVLTSGVAGFTPSSTALTAAFTQSCTSLTIAVQFKIIDTENDYTLFIKHWTTSKLGVTLSLVINPDPNKPEDPIIKHVDAQEAEGGENNLLAISLRNQTYGSVDYHDYLQLGLNTIQITMTPTSGSPDSCGYQIRAISIERS